jgi:hypothetical protein
MFVDPTMRDYRHELLHQALYLMQRISSSEIEKYAHIAREAIGVSLESGTLSLTGADATAAIDVVLEAIRETAQALADRWPRKHWLFSLRALPAFVWGDVESVLTMLERRGVAEALSVLSRAEDPGESWRPVPAPLLIRFAYCAQAYAAAQVARRVAARNVTVYFPVSNLITFDTESPLFACLQEQDRRRLLDPGGDITARFGTQITPAAGMPPTSWKWILMLWPGASYDDPDQVTRLIDGSTTDDFEYTFFATGLNVSDTLLSHQWYDRLLPGVLLLNRVVGRTLAGDVDAQRVVLVFGAIGLEGQLEDLLNELLGSSGPLIDELYALFPAETFDSRYVSDFVAAAAQVRPVGGNLYAGPLLRAGFGSTTIVDLMALSRDIPQLLMPQELPGRFSDLRARHFEKVVQAVVDNSQWRPAGALRLLVGRALAPFTGRPGGGRDLTDVDAIGKRAGKTILINAKSYVASRSLDGDYNSIRNIRTQLEADIVAWREKVAFLDANRVGYNYDLTSAGELIPCVVTPSPHFVHEDLLNDWALSGLRAVSSLAELERFLSMD